MVLLAACEMPNLPSAGSPEEPAARDDGSPEEPAAPDDGSPPAWALADVHAGEADGVLRFAVSRPAAPDAPTTISYATEDGTATAGEDYRQASGSLSFPAGSSAAQPVEVTILDDRIAEASETFTLRLTDKDGATLAVATATIEDDDGGGGGGGGGGGEDATDARVVVVEPAALSVPEGGSASYTVRLGSQPTGTVTVTPRPGSTELSVAPPELSFTAADWELAQTVTVTAAHDADALADAAVPLAHDVRGGGYDGASAALPVTIVEDDVSTLGVAPARVSERGAVLSFAVTLSRAGGRTVTVDYATADDTATEGEDYARATGTLSFPAGSTAALTIEVTVLDDLLDEPDEERLTVTLSNATVPLAGGGGTATVAGTIEDDDPLPRLEIADAGLVEGQGDGTMRFAVRLTPASGRTVTVGYATADGSATAGADYTAVNGTLTFDAGAVARTVTVVVADDTLDEDDRETFTVTLSAPANATLEASTRSATGTIEDDDEPPPLLLTSLQVTGGGTMYPAFDSGIHHYALTCANSATLQVTAGAGRDGATLTLLRADPADNQVAQGMLDVQLAVDQDHDVAIELSDGSETARYVVHCLPEDFPTIVVLTKTDDVSEGFLFVTPRYPGPDDRNVKYMAVLDNNGVPRFHRARGGWVFGPVRFPIRANNRTVKYLHGRQLLSSTFNLIHDITVYATRANGHDLRVTEDGNVIGLLTNATTRDFSGFTDRDGNPLGELEVVDSIIREYDPVFGGSDFYWNSWDHRGTMKPSDCQMGSVDGRYAFINSLQVVDGDVIVSSRGCSQVLRIKRSDGSGDIVWKLGGTDPGAASDAEFLEIVDDPEGEFCGQHTAVLTDRETVLLFDNGVRCLGPRKNQPTFTRVVEYDISSGTQAALIHDYRLPNEYGYSPTMGSVEEVEEARWLISWGNVQGATVALNQMIAVSEVAPASGKVFLHLHMSHGNQAVPTYRARRGPEVDIPLKLP